MKPSSCSSPSLWVCGFVQFLHNQYALVAWGGGLEQLDTAKGNKMKKAMIMVVAAVLAVGLAGCSDWFKGSSTEPTQALDVRPAGYCSESINNGVSASVICTDRTIIAGGNESDVVSVLWAAEDAAGLPISSASGQWQAATTLRNIPCDTGQMQVQQSVQLRLQDGSVTIFSRSAPHIVRLNCFQAQRAG